MYAKVIGYRCVKYVLLQIFDYFTGQSTLPTICQATTAIGCITVYLILIVKDLALGCILCSYIANL